MALQAQHGAWSMTVMAPQEHERWFWQLSAEEEEVGSSRWSVSPPWTEGGDRSCRAWEASFGQSRQAQAWTSSGDTSPQLGAVGQCHLISPGAFPLEEENMLKHYLRIHNWLEREEGQDLAEYALLIGLIALALVGSITVLGSGLDATFQALGDRLWAVVF